MEVVDDEHHEFPAPRGHDAEKDPVPLALVVQDREGWLRELPRELILSTADLDDALNFRGVASFSADALHGVGVFETLKGVSEMVLKRLAAGSTA